MVLLDLFFDFVYAVSEGHYGQLTYESILHFVEHGSKNWFYVLTYNALVIGVLMDIKKVYFPIVHDTFVNTEKCQFIWSCFQYICSCPSVALDDPCFFQQG